MSVLIEGMEMPKNCDDCFFIGRGYPDWCSLPQIPNGEDEIDDTKKRPNWCPLIELPEKEEAEDTREAKRIYTIRKDALRQFVGYLADVNTSKDIAEFIGIPESLVRMLLLDLGMEAADASNMDDGELDFVQKHEKIHVELRVVSVQPEIVYCKDCLCGHGEVWLSGNGSADFYGYCGRTQLRVLAYDYCSYAERRTDD